MTYVNKITASTLVSLLSLLLPAQIVLADTHTLSGDGGLQNQGKPKPALGPGMQPVDLFNIHHVLVSQPAPLENAAGVSDAAAVDPDPGPQSAPTSAPAPTQPRKHGLRHLLIMVGIIGVGIVLPIVLVAVADK